MGRWVRPEVSKHSCMISFSITFASIHLYLYTVTHTFIYLARQLARTDYSKISCTKIEW